MIAWLLSSALATSSFDPTVADQVFSGAETFTTDGSVQLWAAIERHVDRDETLFGPQQFNSATAWPEDSAFAPFIDDCFGTTEPESGAFLLHVGLGAQLATGTPVLFVPGAGDNGSRGFLVMAFDELQRGKPVYALTFSHPHGDVLQQAEVIADAVARIRWRTGAEKVDVVAHSKGGVAAAVYASHTADAAWGAPAYEAVGTPYRGDVRRLVLIATPLDGVDTTYRWSALNYAALEADTAASPASWDDYYPSGVAVPWNKVELNEQDHFPGGGDLFPGQRQVLKRQDAPLPGSLPWLGLYAALQQDWLTTYEGGTGFFSTSRGIDAAVEAGGSLIDKLAAQGVDPGVEIHLLAGTSPLLTNGAALIADQLYESVWVDIVGASIDVWSALIAEITDRTFRGLKVEDADVQGLSSGKLILGEITGKSDGVVLLSSATRTEALTARGATVAQVNVVDLAHLDLLYANPIAADSLLEQAEADPVEYGWSVALAERYAEADTVGWLAGVLADPPVEEPEPEEPIVPDPELPGVRAGCECASGGSSRAAGAGAVLLALGLARRRRARG